MNWLRQRLQGWKTYALGTMTIPGVWVMYTNDAATLKEAIVVTVFVLLACFLGAKIERK